MALRDQHATYEYFSSLIEEEEEYLEEDRRSLLTKIETGDPKAAAMARNIVNSQFVVAEIAFSRGDSIPDVRAMIEQAFADMGPLHRLYTGEPETQRRQHSSYIHDLRRQSFALLFRVGAEARQRASDDFALSNRSDPLLGYLFSCLQGEKRATSESPDGELEFPDTYLNLWRGVAEADADSRAGALASYLDSWYETSARSEAKGVLGIGAHEKMIRYRGYWCWEAGALSLCTGVDDSRFRDHEHYPAELVEWAKNNDTA